MTVFDLKKGEEGRVAAIKLEGAVAARLAALGLKVGDKVQVLSYSLFNSSVLLAFGAVRVGVRKPIAIKIEVAR